MRKSEEPTAMFPFSFTSKHSIAFLSPSSVILLISKLDNISFSSLEVSISVSKPVCIVEAKADKTKISQNTIKKY